MIIKNLYRAFSYLNSHTFSPKKVLNRFKIISEYSKGIQKVESFPNMIHIEPTNHCNLKCIMCPQPTEMKRVKGLMKIDLFRSIIDELKSTPAEFVYLHQFGESLLHKQIYEMIDYAEEAGIKVGLSTNASLLNSKNSQKLLNTKLSFMILSLDGGTQELYNKYRPGDSWQNVKNNVFTFLDLRKNKKGHKPHVICQTISMKGNENSLENLEKLFSKYDVIFNNKPFNEWGGKVDDINNLSTNDSATDSIGRERCEKPYKLFTIEWDGTVVPCTRFFDNQYSYGKYPEQSLREIWNSEKAQKFRLMHTEGREKIDFCSTCSLDGPSPVERIGMRILDITFIEKFIAAIPAVRERRLTSFIEKIRGYRSKKFKA